MGLSRDGKDIENERQENKVINPVGFDAVLVWNHL